MTTTSADGTVLSRVTSDLSADRQTKTITTDATGDGAATRTETIKTGTDGHHHGATIDRENRKGASVSANRSCATTAEWSQGGASAAVPP